MFGCRPEVQEPPPPPVERLSQIGNAEAAPDMLPDTNYIGALTRAVMGPTAESPVVDLSIAQARRGGLWESQFGSVKALGRYKADDFLLDKAAKGYRGLVAATGGDRLVADRKPGACAADRPHCRG
jgi:hypothetical protein